MDLDISGKTSLIRNPLYEKGLKEELRKQEIEEGQGFICLMDHADIIALQVFSDDEVAYILEQKVKHHVGAYESTCNPLDDLFLTEYFA